jgi:polar amino acid transport system substrate-binding protein
VTERGHDEVCPDPLLPKGLHVRIAPRRAAGAVAMTALAGTALAGCGLLPSSGPSAASHAPPRRPVAVDAALVKQVPAALRAKGVLVIGVDATYPPNEFLDADGMTVSGMDVDLFDAVAHQLGLTTEWEPAPFDKIIHDVNAGRYDIGISSFTVTGAREKQSTMVTYFSAGTQWAVQKGNPHHVSADAACGMPIAVQSDTTQQSDLEARSHSCTAHHHAAIRIHTFQDQDSATASVVAGHDWATLADSPVAEYAIKQTDGKLQPLGAIYDSAPYGYVLPKGDTALAKAIAGALARVKANGQYGKALSAWGVQSGAIGSFTLNPKGY